MIEDTGLRIQSVPSEWNAGIDPERAARQGRRGAGGRRSGDQLTGWQ
jgi:hypothetical protein